MEEKAPKIHNALLVLLVNFSYIIYLKIYISSKLKTIFSTYKDFPGLCWSLKSDSFML